MPSARTEHALPQTYARIEAFLTVPFFEWPSIIETTYSEAHVKVQRSFGTARYKDVVQFAADTILPAMTDDKLSAVISVYSYFCVFCLFL